MRRRKPEKHPNGCYYGRIKGKRINLGRNLRQAEKKLREIEKEIERGNLEVTSKSSVIKTPNGKDILLKELAFHHLNWVKENRAEGTYVTRQLYVCRFLGFVGEQTMVSEVTTADIERFYNHERKYNSKGGINAGKHCIRELKTMFRWGQERGYFTVPMVKFPSADTVVPETHLPTMEEMTAIHDASDPDLQDLIKFAVATGCRPQEIYPLKRSQVRKNESGQYLRIQLHKSSKSSKTPMPRSVPLTPMAQEVVDHQMAKHPKSQFVFLNGNGGPYTSGSLRQRFQRACRRAGLDAMRTYDLRHFFGSTMAETTNLALLSQMMGHSRLQTTLRYISNNDKAHREAVGKMDVVLEGLGRRAGGAG